VFTRFEEERADFHSVPHPTTTEREGVVERVARRMIAWRSGAGWLIENEDIERETDGLAACQQMLLMDGTFAKLGRDGEGKERLGSPTDPATSTARSPLASTGPVARLLAPRSPTPRHPCYQVPVLRSDPAAQPAPRIHGVSAVCSPFG
jgi:hypothetical protein